jgi:hypothetical protein
LVRSTGVYLNKTLVKVSHDGFEPFGIRYTQMI